MTPRARLTSNLGQLVEVYLIGGTTLTGGLHLDNCGLAYVDSRNFRRYFDLVDVVAIGEIKEGATF